MATTPQTVPAAPDAPQDLQALAKRHLWMHFTRMGAYEDARRAGHRPGRGLLRLGHAGQPLPRRALGAVLRERRPRPRRDRRGDGRAGGELGFFTNWSYAHPRAIELAARIAALAPGDLNRVFFTSGGSEAVESALKLARNYHRLRGDGAAAQGDRARDRLPRHHARRALAPPGIPALRTPFEPLTPGGCHVPNTNEYHWPEGRDPLWAADEIEERIEFEGPETVAAVILEPVQNAGGCFPPQEGYFQRVREICDRHGVLLISDEVICSWGRLGDWFGCERYDYRPDIITTAKGITSAYAPMGAVIVSDAIAEPFLRGHDDVRPRLHVRRPPGAAAAAHRQPRHLRARGHQRPRAREGARVPRDARGPARPADRRRRARRRLLPGDRARQGQGDARDASTTRSPSACCAASSPASSSAGA